MQASPSMHRSSARQSSKKESEAPAPRPCGLIVRATLNGVGALSNDELLALLLEGQDEAEVRGRASMLLRQSGGLSRLSRLSPWSVGEKSDGSSEEALRVLAALELGRRAELEHHEVRVDQPLTAALVASWAVPRLGSLEHEEVWALCVDAKTCLRSTFQVGRGGAHGCALLARDVLLPVVREGAAGFVLVHNHPSGDPEPSREDLQLTRALSEAALLLSIPLLDHVIVSQSGYRSLLEGGHL